MMKNMSFPTDTTSCYVLYPRAFCGELPPSCICSLLSSFGAARKIGSALARA